MTVDQSNLSSTDRELIAFHLGPQEFCVDIMAVREIRGWTKTTMLPRSPAYICGVVNLRGAVLAIVDLSLRLGFAAAEPNERHVIIVTQIGKQTVGLLVDAVQDIITVSTSKIQPTPDVASDLVKNFVQGVLSIDGRMISLITMDNVLPELHSDAA